MLVPHGEVSGPVLGVPDGLCLVDLPELGDVVGQRVVGVGRREEGLDREEHGADLKRGAPLV